MKKYLSLIIIAVMGLTLICGCAKKPADDEKATLQQEDIQATQQVDDIQTETETKTKTKTETKTEIKTDTKTESDSSDATITQTNTKAPTTGEASATVKSETTAATENDTQTNASADYETDCIEGDKLTGFDAETIQILVSDIFIGKIIAKENIPVDFKLPNIGVNTIDKIDLCTVEVEKVYHSSAVTENTTIQVLYIQQPDFGAFEVGKTYVMTGCVQPYKNKIVLADIGILSAVLNDDNTITPNSKYTRDAFTEIKTLDDFETDFVAKMKDHGPWILTELFSYDLYDFNVDGSTEQSNISAEVGTNQVQSNASSETTADTKPTDEQILAVMKEAIKVDSDVTIKEWQG